MSQIFPPDPSPSPSTDAGSRIRESSTTSGLISVRRLGHINPQGTSWKTPTGTQAPSANDYAASEPSVGWSQAQLATKLAIHQKQVSGYECGVHVPQTELLIRIAETLAVSLDHLAFADRDDTNHAIQQLTEDPAV